MLVAVRRKTAGGKSAVRHKNRRQAAVSRRVVPGRGPSVFAKASPGQGGGTLVAVRRNNRRRQKCRKA
ncbi:MAG: hypothetical protein E7057_01970 [Lentisphaerae bacterium]|nr:hypothetical protein [Lentisphaerota bacterium]